MKILLILLLLNPIKMWIADVSEVKTGWKYAVVTLEGDSAVYYSKTKYNKGDTIEINK